MTTWLLATGIGSEVPPPEGEFYVALMPDGNVEFPGNEILYEIDDLCVELSDGFRDRVFGAAEAYYDGLPALPIWVSDAGNDSDSSIGKQDLLDLIENRLPSWPRERGCTTRDSVGAEAVDKQTGLGAPKNLSQYLYLFDCQALVASLQNRIIETKWDLVTFYKEICWLEVPPYRLDHDTVIWLSGDGSSSRVFSTLTSGIVKLYSLLDIITKIWADWRALPRDLSDYERLKSHGVLYGKASRALRPVDQSVPEFKRLLNLRNELIHEGAWEPTPKVFCRIESGKAVEKWVLLPDTTQEGTLDTFKNRRRFFAQEQRANVVIPKIMIAVWNGIRAALKDILAT